MQEVPDLGTRIDLSICWGAFAIEVKILEGDTGDRVDPRQKAPASAC
ncbi:MAG TPA: hypothetical protein VFO14_13225 [Vicinamibacterales bacterium]|nr:hypothetical protein [Vicinamibacterales bacterium]